MALNIFLLLEMVFIIGCSLNGRVYSKKDSFRNTDIGEEVVIQTIDDRQIHTIVKDIRNDSIFGDSIKLSFAEIRDIDKANADKMLPLKVAGTGIVTAGLVYDIMIASLAVGMMYWFVGMVNGKT